MPQQWCCNFHLRGERPITLFLNLEYFVQTACRSVDQLAVQKRATACIEKVARAELWLRLTTFWIHGQSKAGAEEVTSSGKKTWYWAVSWSNTALIFSGSSWTELNSSRYSRSILSDRL